MTWRGTTKRRKAGLAVLTILIAALLPAPATGTPYTAPDGQTVDVTHSPGLADDPARDQAWVNQLGGYVHLDELSMVKVYLAASSAEITQICGSGAAACYRFDTQTMTILGTLDPNQPNFALAHEYGHHLQNHRSNTPWNTVQYGPKRWATHEDTCAGIESGKYTTGEVAEAWADAYGLLNVPSTPLRFRPWQWHPDLAPGPIDSSTGAVLNPDPATLDVIRSDVLNPWTDPRRMVLEGRFRDGEGDVERLRLRLPLDGRLSASLQAPNDLDAKLALRAGGDSINGRGDDQSLSYEICGARTAIFNVKRGSNEAGRFKVIARRP